MAVAKHGTVKTIIAAAIPKRKRISLADKIEILKNVDAKVPYSEMQAKYGINLAAIGRIKRRRADLLDRWSKMEHGLPTIPSSTSAEHPSESAMESVLDDESCRYIGVPKVARCMFLCPRKNCSFKAADLCSVTEHIRVSHTAGARRRKSRFPRRIVAETGETEVIEDAVVKQKRKRKTNDGKLRFFCTQSGCEFASKTNCDFVRHMRTHTGEKPFKCTWEDCSFATTQATNLRFHVATHSEEKPYACSWEDCDLRFKDPRTLHQHKRIHTNDKPFACEWEGCGYRTARPAALTYHKMKHTGEMPYECNINRCTFKTRKRYRLTSHVCSVHGKDSLTTNQMLPNLNVTNVADPTGEAGESLMIMGVNFAEECESFSSTD